MVLIKRIIWFALLCPLALFVAIEAYIDHGEPLAWTFIEAWEHTGLPK